MIFLNYFSLKTQQGLLVDFSAFPQKFIALLQLCHGEENNENAKFLLNVSDFYLKRIKCIFRNLTFPLVTILSDYATPFHNDILDLIYVFVYQAFFAYIVVDLGNKK